MTPLMEVKGVAEEAQEETCFEAGGTTWYLDSQSGTDTDSPRGNIHDV